MKLVWHGNVPGLNPPHAGMRIDQASPWLSRTQAPGPVRSRSLNHQTLINFALFQLGWFVCVLGGAWGWPWAGVAFVGLATAWHLRVADNPRGEVLLLIAAAAIGTVVDSLLPAAGWVVYPSGQLHQAIAPVWIVALWILFAGTLNMSMRWLRGRYVLALLFGAIGSPLSFFAGSRLGAVTLVDPVMALGAQSLMWGLVLPLLVWLAGRCAQPQGRAIAVGA